MNTDDNVSAADVAHIAGVGRAAVSNWRVRYADFPKPNGGTARHPTFDRAEVMAWLDNHSNRRTTRFSTTIRASKNAIIALLDHVERRRPGAWVVRADIAQGTSGRVAALRDLDSDGVTETTTISVSGARCMLVRRRVARPRPVNVAVVQRRANKALQPLGYQVDVRPTPATTSAFTPVTVTYRKRAYRAYLHTHPWTLSLTLSSQESAS